MNLFIISYPSYKLISRQSTFQWIFNLTCIIQTKYCIIYCYTKLTNKMHCSCHWTKTLKWLWHFLGTCCYWVYLVVYWHIFIYVPTVDVYTDEFRIDSTVIIRRMSNGGSRAFGNYVRDSVLGRRSICSVQSILDTGERDILQ